MKVIICGAGQVGYGIARHLAGEDNDITIIDRSQELVARIQNQIDVRAVAGHGSHPSVLRDAGAENADMLIAVTASDEVNMVACTIAHNLFENIRTIARVRDPKYLSSKTQHLIENTGLSVDVVISPEAEVANAVIRRLAMPGTFDNAIFGRTDEVQMLGIHIGEDCPVVDTPLNQLTDLFPDLETVVVGVERNQKLYVPRSHDSLLVGDRAYLITSTHDAQRTLKIFGEEIHEAHRLVMIGAGNIGLAVAKKLSKRGYTLTLIESDDARSKTAANFLRKHTTVLHGSGLSPEILADADVRNSDIILALTNDDQVNILSTMLALNEGCSRGMCLINDTAFHELAASVGMEVAINPRAVTVSSVLRHVRHGSIERVHALADGRAEIIQAIALETSELIGQKLESLDLPDGIRFGAILRNQKIIKPRGHTEIRLNDRVILFALTHDIENVEKLFAEPILSAIDDQ